MTAQTRQRLVRLFALLVVILISIWIYSIRDRADEFAQYGYAGIFIISFMAYATVFLPAPGVAIIAAMGTVFNPFWIGIVAGLGAAFGEIVGYMAGYSSQGIAAKIHYYERLGGLTKRYGYLAVFLLAAIPNPLFDLAGAAAGTLRMPVIRFFLACWAGETIKMMLFAFGGSKIGNLLG